MTHQALRPIALMLSVLLIAAVPAQAGSIRFGDVISLATVNGQSGRQTVDLRLRSVNQSGRANSQDAQKPNATGDSSQERTTSQGPSASTSGDAAGETVVRPQSGSTQVETIELGDVQGTICDCGEIFIPKGAFPVLPLLALAGIPLLFIPRGDDEPPPTNSVFPTPTPTPTNTTPPPPGVPEPATLLLLGSGLVALGAGARRRRSLRHVAQEIETLNAREV